MQGAGAAAAPKTCSYGAAGACCSIHLLNRKHQGHSTHHSETKLSFCDKFVKTSAIEGNMCPRVCDKSTLLTRRTGCSVGSECLMLKAPVLEVPVCQCVQHRFEHASAWVAALGHYFCSRMAVCSKGVPVLPRLQLPLFPILSHKSIGVHQLGIQLNAKQPCLILIST